MPKSCAYLYKNRFPKPKRIPSRQIKDPTTGTLEENPAFWKYLKKYLNEYSLCTNRHLRRFFGFTKEEAEKILKNYFRGLKMQLKTNGRAPMAYM
jgi:hypothetical protein